LGNVVNTTDEAGRILQTYEYEAFGRVRNISFDPHNDFRSLGAYGLLQDDATDFRYNRARYYDAEIGRFISRDPIGIAGGINLYGYAGNNAVNWVDPSGLYWFRQPGQKEVVGRVGHPLVPEGGAIGMWIEHNIPAGWTFGHNHDAFVGFATGMGIPDLLANIPSMPALYIFSVMQELFRSLLEYLNELECSKSNGSGGSSGDGYEGNSVPGSIYAPFTQPQTRMEQPDEDNIIFRAL
jgi:RHS repeat-associated protein